MTNDQKRDRVLNAIHEMLMTLEIPSYTGWDIEKIGSIRDFILDELSAKNAEAVYPTEDEFAD